MFKRIFISGLFLLTFISTTSIKASAQDIDLSVTGNGDVSTNDVSVTSNNNINVTQSNNTDIQNNVNNNANTGDNTSNSNTGDVSIQTGDINSSTTIDNQNINSNMANNNCCVTNLTGQITENGSDSSNNIDLNSNNNLNLTQTNIANIINNSETFANTGGNSADKNNGDVNISTGNIVSETNTNNKNINISSGSLGTNGEDINMKIGGNGDGSDNKINLEFHNDIFVNVTNIANILNNNFADINTGRNSANGNNGNVSIETGAITLINNITNKDINLSFLKIGCAECKDGDDDGDDDEENDDDGDDNHNPPPPGTTPPPPPVNPGSTNPPGTSVSGPGPGEVLAAVTSILPATGGYWLFLLTMANIAMFFMGWYLRLRSGNSPGVVYA